MTQENSEGKGRGPSGEAPAGAPRILHLTLHRRWFDAIAQGRKKAEYRLHKPYWAKRLETREYDEIHFRNGYAKAAPWMRVEWCGCHVGRGGETLPVPYRGNWIFAIQLGRILEIRNYNAQTAERSGAPEAKPKGPTPNFNPAPTLKGPA